MGQKVSPTGLRIGINKDWESKWYAENDFAKYLNNDYKIRKYLNKKFKNAGISQIVVERNPKRCEIFIRERISQAHEKYPHKKQPLVK